MSESVRLLHISLHWHITGEKHLKFLRGGDITSTPIDTKHRTPAARAPLSAWLKRDRDDSRDRVRGARCIQIETSWTLSSSVLLMLSGRWNRDGEEFCVMNTNEWTTPTSGLWITITDALTWSLRASMAKHANNKQAPLSKNLNKAILHYIAIEIFKKKSFFHCLKPTPH